MNRYRLWKNLFRTNTLKNELTRILVFSSLIPIAFIGIMSYYTISSIQQNKVTLGIYSALNQARQGIENTLNNLNYASKQLALNGEIGKNLDAYLSGGNSFEKFSMRNSIEDSLRVINFSNQDLGLMMYYLPDAKTGSKILFENLQVKDDFDISQLPFIFEQNGISYYGPHKTAYKYGNNIVLSMVRKACRVGDTDVYVYMETNYKLVQRIINGNNYAMNVCHFVVGESGQVVFHEENKYTEIQPLLSNIRAKTPDFELRDGFYVFKVRSEAPWQLGTVIKKSDFNSEMNTWLYQYFLITIITLIISVFFALTIWRKVYHPIRIIRNQIKLVGNSQFDSPLIHTNTEEFDHLLDEFSAMRQKIQALLIEVEEKERRKRYLEIERLLYKINPHFLHNTLDTIRWMALLSDNDDIGRTVSALNRLIHYNLRDQGDLVLVSEELEVIKDYISIQKMKYEFNFELEVDDKFLNASIPRFILQPIVENAFKHGVMDNGLITIKIYNDNDKYLVFDILDNGTGIQEDARKRILNSKWDDLDGSIGIGIRYVKSTLQRHYEDRAFFDIYSPEGQGTAVTLKIPL